MKKVIAVLICLFYSMNVCLAENVKPTEVVSITNRCAVVNNNTVSIPVKVIASSQGVLTDIITEYTLGKVENNKDTMVVRIDSIEGEYVSNITLDYNRDSNSRSNIYYYLEEDIETEVAEEIMSFNVNIEFIEELPDSVYVLGNEVILSDKDVCDIVNGYEITEVEKIIYINNEETNYSAYILTCLFIVSLIICIVLLIRRNK